MKSKFMAVAAALALAVAWPASSASAGEGLYVSGHGGFSVAGGSKTRTNGGGIGFSKGKTSYKFGAGGGFAVGYTFAPMGRLGGYRVEYEFDLFHANPDKRKGTAGTFAGTKLKVSGSTTQYTSFINGYRDFDELKDIIPSVTPFVGIGIGLSVVDLNNVGLPLTRGLSDTDIVFAGQIITGLSYDIMPRMVLSGEYRFIITTNPNFKDAPAAAAATKLRSQNYRHVFGFSLRYYIN